MQIKPDPPAVNPRLTDTLAADEKAMRAYFNLAPPPIQIVTVTYRRPITRHTRKHP